MKTINIYSRGRWPASALTNFAPNIFEFRGFTMQSMESLLQALKFEDVEEQKAVFGLNARQAKKAGKKSRWQDSQMLWWRGQPMGRLSEEFQSLLDEAFATLYAQSVDFQEALRATGDAALVHRIGKIDPRQTVLTQDEFTSRLTTIRASLQHQEV